MSKHKHKPSMVMVISIGAKPKKKGETGVKKAPEPVNVQGGLCKKCKKKPWTYWNGYCDQCNERFGGTQSAA